MSGGSQSGGTTDNGQSMVTNAAQTALASSDGSGGAAAAAVQNIPQWQKGLLGLTTGNAAYGKNAPALHQLMTQGLGMMSSGRMPGQSPQPLQSNGLPPGQTSGPSMAPAPGVVQRPMGQPAAQPLGNPQAMPPSGMAPMGSPGMGGGNPMANISPQMLAQLRQQYPQLFGQGQPGMGM